MFSKYFYAIVGFLLIGWVIHIYEGNTALEMANRACDPIYWTGKFLNKEVTSGFTQTESESYKYSEEIGSDMGKACFWASSRVFKAVNPNWNYNETQIFNYNELQAESTHKAKY